MAWIIPENKLDTQQRDFLDNVDIDRRNIWIKGFAGSGKSVLLVYTVKKIRSRSSHSRIMLIVFTKSLVEMFKAAFKELGLNIDIDTYYGFMKSGNHYDYILCDEVQDLTPRVISEMNSRCSQEILISLFTKAIHNGTRLQFLHQRLGALFMEMPLSLVLYIACHDLSLMLYSVSSHV